jgi:hypothetical protein
MVGSGKTGFVGSTVSVNVLSSGGGGGGGGGFVLSSGILCFLRF